MTSAARLADQVVDSRTPGSRVRVPEWAVHLAVGCLSLATFLGVARLDPDPHHDGVMLAPAVAVAEGLAIHADAFSQYGPVTAWLQALAVLVAGPELLALRIQAAVVLALVAVLMSVITRRLTGSSVLAALTAGVWVSASPVWSSWAQGASLAPWSSVVFAALSLGSTWALLRAVSSPAGLRGWSVVAGALIGLGIFTRTQLGLVHAVATLVVVLLLWLAHDPGTRPRWNRSVAGWYLVGLALAIGLVLAVLLSQGALDDFVAQAIVGPVDAYLTEWDMGRLIVGLGILPLIACSFLAAAVQVLGGVERGRSPVGVGAALLLALGAMCVAAFVVVIIRIEYRWPMTPASQCLISLAPAASGLLLVRAFLPAPLRLPDTPHLRGQLALVAVGGAAAWAQFVPLGDPHHIWWAAPLPMISTFVLGYELASTTVVRRVLLGLALLVLLQGVRLYRAEVAVPRTELGDGPLDGMLVMDTFADDWSELDAFLADKDLPTADVISDDGVYAVWDGRYTPADAAYVAWAWGVDRAADDRRYILYCHRGLPGAAEFAADERARVLEQTGRLDLFNYPARWESCAWLEREPGVSVR